MVSGAGSGAASTRSSNGAKERSRRSSRGRPAASSRASLFALHVTGEQAPEDRRLGGSRFAGRDVGDGVVAVPLQGGGATLQTTGGRRARRQGEQNTGALPGDAGTASLQLASRRAENPCFEVRADGGRDLPLAVPPEPLFDLDQPGQGLPERLVVPELRPGDGEMDQGAGQQRRLVQEAEGRQLELARGGPGVAQLQGGDAVSQESLVEGVGCLGRRRRQSHEARGQENESLEPTHHETSSAVKGWSARTWAAWPSVSCQASSGSHTRET